jgi:hypothetical protein
LEQDFGSKPWSQTSWETLGARFRWKYLESDFGGSAWSQTLMGNTWRKILGETRKPLEQDFREDTHGARPRGEHSWSKTSGETLGAKLRGKCWEQNYGGNPWSKTSAETLEARLLRETLGTRRGGKPLEQDFRGNPWSKAAGETLGARILGKPLDQDFGGNPLSMIFGGNPWSKTSSRWIRRWIRWTNILR